MNVKKSFDYFVQKIPLNIHDNTKSIITSHIAIFIPEKFVVDKRLYVEEYHFVVCFTTPPPVTISSKEHQFKKGSIICMAPGDDILVHQSDGFSPATYITICVKEDFLQRIYLQSGGEGILSFKKRERTYSYQLLEGIEALIYEITNFKETNSLMIESLENRIAIQLLRDTCFEFKAIGNDPQNPQDNMQRAIKYIETYYSSNITVKDICKAVYLSPSHLQKIFLKHVGKTPYQYIIECRLGKAKAMLETADVSLEEIARQCGFVNRAHFSTVFKQKEGLSPLAYKKLIKNNEPESVRPINT